MPETPSLNFRKSRKPPKGFTSTISMNSDYHGRGDPSSQAPFPPLTQHSGFSFQVSSLSPLSPPASRDPSAFSLTAFSLISPFSFSLSAFHFPLSAFRFFSSIMFPRPYLTCDPVHGVKISTLNPHTLNWSKSESRVTQVQPFSRATAACCASPTNFPWEVDSMQIRRTRFQ